MLGVIILLYLILSHLFYNSFKDCLKVYLKKYIKIVSKPTKNNTYTLEKLLRKIQRWPGVIRTETQLILSSNKLSSEDRNFVEELVSQYES